MTLFKFNSEFLRRVTTAAMVLFIGATSLLGCMEADALLGTDFVPEEQKMRFGTTEFNSLNDGVEYFQTRLFISDSITTSNQSYLYMGAMHSDTFGMRTSGFYVQYTPSMFLDSAFFGYLPIIDSAILLISMADYIGDTTYVQDYEVFAIVDDSFIDGSVDSVFFGMSVNGAQPLFDIENYIDESDPIFTFKFPDQDNDVYTDATYVRLQETSSGRQFMRELLFLDDDGGYKIDTDYDGDGQIDTADIREIYETFDFWLDKFKGLYVRPTSTPTASGYQGAMYASDILYSGFTIMGRSLEEEDIEIVKDTVGMVYYFYPMEDISDVDDDTGLYGGELSINNITHDYSTSKFFNYEQDVLVGSEADKESVGTVSTVFIEGMGGIVSQLTLNKEIFLKLDTILDDEYASSGDEFESLFFNQAVLKIYLTKNTGVESNYLNIDPLTITPWLNSAPTQLGLYTKYTAFYDDDEYYTLTGIGDYYYYYEQLGYDIGFDGALNRNWGCYSFNIPSQLEMAWNSFLTAKEAANNVVDDINWDDVEYRDIYIAPAYYELYSLKNVALQTMTWNEGGSLIEDNNVPMELSLTYTMID
ncbi:MAG: DUF4270 family protein [Rikenellaceae bacterium]